MASYNLSRALILKIHLCGLPLTLHRRLKDESQSWEMGPDWSHSLRVTPINSNTPRAFTTSEREEIKKAVAEGFIHVALLATRDWRQIMEDLLFDCRVIILRPSDEEGKLVWSAVRTELINAAEVEDHWLQRIAPKDIHHQLLLPPTVFTPTRPLHTFWKACDVYKKAAIEGAEKILELVDATHRKRLDGQRIWIDAKSRNFLIDPSFHGRSQADREGIAQYRFCFQVPPGFHYDVSKRGDHFEIEINGQRKRTAHVNVTPWGRIRNG